MILQIDISSSFSSVSGWTLVGIGILGAALFVTFYIVNEFVIKLIKNRKIRSTASWYFPIVKGLVWMMFAILVCYKVIEPHPLVGATIVLILIIASWSYVKNYVAGIYLRMQGNYRVGQRIEINDIEGNIKRFLTTNLEIEVNNGELILYPYSAFSGSAIRKPSTANGLQQFSFSLQPDKDLTYDRAKEMLYNCSFVVTKIPPIITILENGNYDVMVYVLKPSHKILVKEYVANRLKN